jgi:hypothetical protein
MSTVDQRHIRTHVGDVPTRPRGGQAARARVHGAPEDLGTFRIALSQSEMREGVSIEGESLALDWEAPNTFETRKTWVRQAVEEAKKRLVKC